MTKTQKFPKWLHKPMPPVHSVQATSDSIQKARLHTVCEEAKCPNRLECYAQKTATFLLLGSVCTRACSFCEIGFSKTPPSTRPERTRTRSAMRARTWVTACCVDHGGA